MLRDAVTALEDFTKLVQIYGYAGDWHRALHLLEEWTDDPRIPNPKPHLVTESAVALTVTTSVRRHRKRAILVGLILLGNKHLLLYLNVFQGAVQGVPGH